MNYSKLLDDLNQAIQNFDFVYNLKIAINPTTRNISAFWSDDATLKGCVKDIKAACEAISDSMTKLTLVSNFLFFVKVNLQSIYI